MAKAARTKRRGNSLLVLVIAAFPNLILWLPKLMGYA